jgi:hypothetical protein
MTQESRIRLQSIETAAAGGRVEQRLRQVSCPACSTFVRSLNAFTEDEFDRLKQALLIAQLTETLAPAPSAYSQLQALEWLVGNWKDKAGDQTIQTKVNWAGDKNFLVRTSW